MLKQFSSKHYYEHNAKFTRLLKSLDFMQWSIYLLVVNFSSIDISEIRYSVVKRNSNFEMSKKNASFLQLIAPVKNSFENSVVSEIQTENLRYLFIAYVNCNSNHTKSNLTSDEKTALNDLKTNDNIVITKAIKGGHIVPLDKKTIC